MNFELYIAKRIVSSKGFERTPKSQTLSSFIGTKPIINIALLGIALGLAVMITAIAIITGFKSEIRDKVIGFGSHIQITNYDSNISYESNPISKNQTFYPALDTVQGIRHIQVFATKAAIIKTDDEIQSVVMKGIGSDFDWEFFNRNIVAGKAFAVNDFSRTDDVIISAYIAAKLKLKVSGDLRTYFIDKENKIRARKFNISGIYETGLEEYDKLYVFADIGHIQKLNNWETDQIGGFEVLIDKYEDLDEMAEYIYYNVIGHDLYAQSVKELYYQVFDWLELQNMNIQIILVLMALVAGINMISALLVLILDRTNMIGIMKALGSADLSIRKVFIYIAIFLIGKGMLWGNAIGILLCIIQKQFEIITLDQASYYISVVPIKLDLWSLVLLNIGTLTVCVLMLIIPSQVISKITPVKAIRFN